MLASASSPMVPSCFSSTPLDWIAAGSSGWRGAFKALGGGGGGWLAGWGGPFQAAERVICCLDVGHIGLRQAAAKFGDSHPGLNLKKLSPVDDRMPGLVAEVPEAGGRGCGEV